MNPADVPIVTLALTSDTVSLRQLSDIADTLHARRIAATPPGAAITRHDTDCLIHLVATAAFGDALFGAQLHRSAGLPETSETDRGFRRWLAALVRAHSAQKEG